MSILEDIVEVKKQEVLLKKNDLPVRKMRLDLHPGIRSFKGSLLTEGFSIIAEIKRRSPSEGVIRESIDPVAIAQTYESYGASAISVVTDQRFFGGEDGLISAVKKVVHLPILRKDFIIDEYQIYESRMLGADAVLLIARLLNRDSIDRFIGIAGDLKMDCLVEVHDADELNGILKTRAEIIGVNNRNLDDFSVSLETSIQLKKRIPEGPVTVSESGIHSSSDLYRIKKAGFDAVLIGTSLMKAGSIGAVLNRFMKSDESEEK